MVEQRLCNRRFILRRIKRNQRILRVHQPFAERGQHRIFVFEIMVERGWGNACTISNPVGADSFDALFRQQLPRRVEQLFVGRE